MPKYKIEIKRNSFSIMEAKNDDKIYCLFFETGHDSRFAPTIYEICSVPKSMYGHPNIWKLRTIER